MQPGQILRQYLDRKAMTAFAEAPTQVTDAIRTIRPVKLVHTDRLPVVVEPPEREDIPICFVQPALLDITPLSRNVILSALRMVFVRRYVRQHNRRYAIAGVDPDPSKIGSFLAHLEREDG